MNKLRRILPLIVVSAALAGGAVYLGATIRSDNEPDAISCTARMVTIRGERRANLMMIFNVNPKLLNGVVNVNGIISENNEIKEKLYRRTAFSYTKYKTYYRFTSKQIQPASDEHIAEVTYLDILPEFFTRQGADVDWKVTREGDQGYLFSVGKIPRFFCEL
ncbi:TPA: hypothetical protein JAN03_11740 [Citrobacter freundii]|nr:hypothetical protein [Citrobacter freundii]